MHIEFLVEEQSCAEALNNLVPRIIGDRASFGTHVFQGKRDLLSSLPKRLRGYANWLPADRRIVVLVDRDADDCMKLKANLEKIAKDSGLKTRASCRGKGAFHVLNRIAIEELEAWFFGDVGALVAAFPRIPATLGARRGFRDPDAVAGGTWEKLQRVLQDAGYYRAGMPKIEVARKVSKEMDPDRNKSRSFRVFRNGLRSLVA